MTFRSCPSASPCTTRGSTSRKRWKWSCSRPTPTSRWSSATTAATTARRRSPRSSPAAPHAIVCRRECLPHGHWRLSDGMWCEGVVDWDFSLRLFLHHRGAFVEDVYSYYNYDDGGGACGLIADSYSCLTTALVTPLMPL